ncbi:transcription factor bHLH14-like [Phragmites australis]|uniref:transcription factor bHLH14-like n=1 Tax=Phragmites australis TaxID=29695 RepID=UPI002D7814A9|nr:transcription factor bHLH14-like [Phragmites australis]
MDEHVRLTSSCSPPSPGSSAAGHHVPVLDFLSSEVLEQWLLDDDDVQYQPLELGAACGDGSSRSAGSDDLSGNLPPAAAPKRRGRKPLPRTDGSAVSHVEAEQLRRDRFHRRFCDLRAAVPTVSRMDKASLLADATAYIAELRGRVEQLEAEVTQAAARKAHPADVDAAASSHDSFGLQEKLEVRMFGQEAAALRLTTEARHAPARFMDALRSLDLPVQHTCVCRHGGVTVQDAVVDVPAVLRDEGCLRGALLHRLQESGSLVAGRLVRL